MKRSGFLFDQGTLGDWRHFRPFWPTLGMFENVKEGKGKRNKTEHRHMRHAAKMKYIKSSESLPNILGVAGSRSKQLENVSRLEADQGHFILFRSFWGAGTAAQWSFQGLKIGSATLEPQMAVITSAIRSLDELLICCKMLEETSQSWSSFCPSPKNKAGLGPPQKSFSL